MSKAVKTVDIRAIDFIKTLNGPFFSNGGEKDDQKNTYICLGHFEKIQIREVSRKNNGTIFADIWHDSCEKNSKDDLCTFPLYILHSGYNDALKKFWDKKYPCIVVSRVHCDQPKDRNNFISGLKDNVKNLCLENFEFVGDSESDEDSDRVLGDLSVRIGDDEDHCAFYQTLELGDIAVILKSNSMVSCLKISKSLMEQQTVGDIYSYCGLHTQLFSDGNRNQICKNFSCKPQEVKNALGEPIPQVSTRFAIHSSFFADLLWEKLGIREKIYFVTGTADAIVDLSNDNCFDLIKMINTLSAPHKYEEVVGQGRQKRKNTYSYTCSHAFDDVVTRVGIEFGSISCKSKTPDNIISAKAPAANAQKELRIIQKQVEQKLKMKNYDWLAALSTQVQLLLTMMNNCVMDDLSLLIWPSACAFIRRLDYIVLQKQCTLEKEEIEDIEIFLNGWSILSNDIIHLESQLVQNPKLQAPRVHVPAELLAFYMAFLDKLNALLYKMDQAVNSASTPCRQYQPLIAHGIGLRPNTLCILDPSKDEEQTYSKDCPLLVSLPISLMYHPEDVTVILCHEYLHYAGEFSRLRKKRVEMILKTCAGSIINRWHLDKRNNATPYIINLSKAIDFLTKKIIEKSKQGNTKAFRYIYLLEEELPGILADIYLDWQLQSTVLNQFCSSVDVQENFLGYAKQFTPARYAEDIKIIRERLDEILLLYRECYADVAAILCLGLDKKTYLASMYHRELAKTSESENTEDLSRPLQALAVQAAVVCTVSFQGRTSEADMNAAQNWDITVEKFIDQIQTGVDLWYKLEGYENKWDFLYTSYEYLPLISYLTCCAEEIEKQLIYDEVKELKQMYKIISAQDIDLDKFGEIIDKYHQGLI